jgi:2-polyprenyl-3-methyl-5-hydroxy-6-metoxy-1,4-benzoquinol methylase
MSRDYWENRYQTNDMSWEKGAPSPGLVDFLAAHPELSGGDAPVAMSLGVMLAAAPRATRPPLTVCVPGCGTGNDVRALAAAGFDAHGFDFAPSAIQLSRDKTAAAGLKAHFAQADFLHDEPPQKFDWLFEHTLFCAIQPSERDAYVRALLRWLKPGGQYLAVNYLLCEPKGPPWPVTREELLARFSPHFDLRADWLPPSYPSRTGKERMFWWSRKTAAVA